LIFKTKQNTLVI